MRIIVLPGDGIGPEISAATTHLLRTASERFQLGLVLEEHAVGHASLAQLAPRCGRNCWTRCAMLTA